MTQKQMIFFDIDGTLLNHNKELPESTKMAVKKLQELGHVVAIATGRAPFMFKDLRDELGIHTYVSFNGSYCVYEGKTVYVDPLDQEELHLLTQFSVSRKNPLIYEHHDHMYKNVESHLYIEEGIGSLKINEIPLYDPHFYHNKEVYQSLLFCMEEEEEHYRDQFKKFEFVRWHEYSMDVLPAGGSKAKGIEALISHLHIPMERVYAFGDGLNDIEMLSFVKNSIAMGNAEEQVKAVATYVTHDVDQDGILKGLQLVGLLEDVSI
ncbi:Cof-type HAD-IIB family hydrolase [Bacillus sp. JJ1764]|uniref:Cof-type HAD-IIB family hydrolase n=1 Tax=Bacillus sp. JJ1764 TaxID=3122964 RepID=UPI002FFFF443